MSRNTNEDLRYDVYPVGIFDDIRVFWYQLRYRYWVQRPRKRAYTPFKSLRYKLKRPLLWLMRGQFRAFKNYFNGYICEPENWLDGMTSAGSGWTKRRAVRDLTRKMTKAQRSQTQKLK